MAQYEEPASSCLHATTIHGSTPLVASPKANYHADPPVCWSSSVCRTPSNPWVCITRTWLRGSCVRSTRFFTLWFAETTTSRTWCSGESMKSSINCLFKVGAGHRCRSLTFGDLSSVKARRRGNEAEDDIKA